MNSIGFGLYLFFICSWFLHLTARVPVLGALRMDMLVVVALMACSFAVTDDRPPGNRRISRILWGLVAYALLTIPLVEWPGSVLAFGFPAFFRAFVFFYLTHAFVGTRQRLKTAVGVFVACQVFRILEPLYLHVTEGYWGSFASMAGWEAMDRLSGAPYDVINPNGLAFVVLMTLPLLHYLSSGHVVSRIVYLALLPALIYTLLLTGSRSGLVGLAAIALLVCWKSRHKVALAGALAVGVAVAVPLLSADMKDRYVSIWDSDAKNAGTAEGRLVGVERDFRVAMRRPLFGHGLGTSREANANFGGIDKPSHNLYTEIAQELGGIGLGIFLYFIWSLGARLRAVVRHVRATLDAEIYEAKLATALQVWVGMNVLFSFAAYGLSEYEWYFAAGLTAALDRLSAGVTPAGAAAPDAAEGPEPHTERPACWPALPARVSAAAR
jgi:O-antigen ligase